MCIHYFQALVGTTLTVPTLDGRKVPLRISRSDQANVDKKNSRRRATLSETADEKGRYDHRI